MSTIPNMVVSSSTLLPSPTALCRELPLSQSQRYFLIEKREQAKAIIDAVDPRLVIFAGPCSVHSPELTLQYALKIKELSKQVDDRIFLIMRVFLEKPRTRFGWKGFLYDPFLDGSDAIVQGLYSSRALLRDIVHLGVPIATEFLDPLLFPYHSDLITWGVIGARTTASQVHRQMASSLPMPIGFKNETNGQVENAIFGALAAHHAQTVIGIDNHGHICALKSQGNPHTHLILRGGTQSSNYDCLSLAQVIQKQRLIGLYSRLIIDCAHGNSKKREDKQKEAFFTVLNQWKGGNDLIMGLMLESHLKGGNQLSLTDPCLDWDVTTELIFRAYEHLTRISKLTPGKLERSAFSNNLNRSFENVYKDSLQEKFEISKHGSKIKAHI